MEATVAAALANRQRLRDVMDRRDALAQRIRNLIPYGDFELPHLDDLGGNRLWFYVVPQRQLRQMEATGRPWQVVHADSHAAWVVVVSPDEPRSLSRLRQRMESFDRIHGLVERDYSFPDKPAARGYFTRLTGLFKNLNYAPADSPDYLRLSAEIDALEGASFHSPTA